MLCVLFRNLSSIKISPLLKSSLYFQVFSEMKIFIKTLKLGMAACAYNPSFVLGGDERPAWAKI
jgi:hypothetical protein